MVVDWVREHGVVDMVERWFRCVRVAHADKEHSHHAPTSCMAMNRRTEVTSDATAKHISTAIDAAEQRVRTAVPIAKIIYLEPDLRRPSPAASDR